MGPGGPLDLQNRLDQVPRGARRCQAISRHPEQSATGCQQLPRVAPLLLHKSGRSSGGGAGPPVAEWGNNRRKDEVYSGQRLGVRPR